MIKERLSERTISVLPSIWNTIPKEKLKLSNDRRSFFSFQNDCVVDSLPETLIAVDVPRFSAWRGRLRKGGIFCGVVSSRKKVKPGKRRASKFRPRLPYYAKSTEITHFSPSWSSFQLSGRGFLRLSGSLFYEKPPILGGLWHLRIYREKKLFKHVGRHGNWR